MNPNRNALSAAGILAAGDILKAPEDARDDSLDGDETEAVDEYLDDSLDGDETEAVDEYLERRKRERTVASPLMRDDLPEGKRLMNRRERLRAKAKARSKEGREKAAAEKRKREAMSMLLDSLDEAGVPRGQMHAELVAAGHDPKWVEEILRIWQTRVDQRAAVKAQQLTEEGGGE